MENEREDITETRVRWYRKALEQLRKKNEADAAAAKKAEAESEKKPQGQRSDRADTTVHEGSDKA